MRRAFLINLALVLASAPVMAKDGPPLATTRKFLRVEPSTWDWFGVVLKKDDQKVGPEFFGVVPSLAVEGSAEGERHARRSRVFQGFTFGLGVTSLGLLVGSASVRQADHRWNDTALILGAGGIASLVASFACALGRDREALEAVNSYNYDLSSGSLVE